MLSRSTLGRTTSGALRRSSYAPATRRGLAAPASGSFQYQMGESAGIKFASRDIAGPTTTVALVSRAGTRYEPVPGLAEALEKFSFRGTTKRSPLRIVRETELLGAELFTHHSRETLLVGAKFLRDDLPYFVELLAEVAQESIFPEHVWAEDISPLIEIAHKRHLASTHELAKNSVHGVAFHRGLGEPTAPSSSTYKNYVNVDLIKRFYDTAYQKQNFAIVANGAEHAEFSKWANEFFSGHRAETAEPSQPFDLSTSQTKYYGGEERIAHSGGNTMIIAFPGSSTFTGGFYKPEITVLASLLGGQSSIKWSPGFSLLSKEKAGKNTPFVTTKSAIYSDAGLLTVTIDGSARDVGDVAKTVVKSLNSIAQGEVSKEDVAKAVALAQFKELEFGQNLQAGLQLTGVGLIHQGKPYQLDESAKAIAAVKAEQVVSAAKTILENKASVSAVGDLHVLPWAEEIGLKV